MSEDSKSGGFWRSVPGILTATAGTITAVAGLIAALSQAGLFGKDDAARSAVESRAESPAAIDGRWTAQVAYPWNLTKQEAFTFRVEGERIIGTATYLGVPRAIEAGKVTGTSVSFTTRAEEMLGQERRGFENRYDGIVSPRGINFVLQDTRGTGPIEFTARRSD